VVTVLVLLGQVLELRAREQTGGAIRALLDLAPKTARRLAKDGSEHDVPLEQLAVRDLLRVRPGEEAPVDGELIEGRSAVDESAHWGNVSPNLQCRRPLRCGNGQTADGYALIRRLGGPPDVLFADYDDAARVTRT
jgi:P-type E1-E2 ATPase